MIGVPCVRGASIRHVTGPKGAPVMLVRGTSYRLIVAIDLGKFNSVACLFDPADSCHEAWRWTKVKRKTDRDDALKLAKLAVMGQLPTVHVPSPEMRQRRRLV